MLSAILLTADAPEYAFTGLEAHLIQFPVSALADLTKHHMWYI
jgi:hypothetical protein